MFSFFFLKGLVISRLVTFCCCDQTGEKHHRSLFGVYNSRGQGQTADDGRGSWWQRAETLAGSSFLKSKAGGRGG